MQLCPEKVSIKSRITVAQIAHASGKPARTVRWRMSKIPAGDSAQERAWPLELLPEDFRAAIVAQAVNRGQTVEALLSEAERPFEFKIDGKTAPLSELADECLEKAAKLQRALMPMIELRNASMSVEQFEQQGTSEYRCVFGHAISGRHWRRLFKRTVSRAGKFLNWADLQLYVAENAWRKEKPKVFDERKESEFAELNELIADFAEPLKPTPREKAALWSRVFELFSARLSGGESKRIKGKFLDFLLNHARWVADNREALRVNFDRKLKVWKSAGKKACKLVDRRGKTDRAKTEFPKADVDKTIWHTIANCGGRVSQGVRELYESGQLTPQTGEYLRSALVKGKSNIPRPLRSLITPEVRMLKAYHQGKRAVDQERPSLTRDYSGMFAHEELQIDDFTLPLYFFVPDGDWFRLERGQFLPIADVRTWRILFFVLKAAPNYDSGTVFTLCQRTFESFGLPKKLYLEKGQVFGRAKLLKGSRSDLAGISPAEAEVGFQEFGIEFQHAIRARSKIIEGIGRMLQAMMEGIPGYCGREERKDRPEALSSQMAEVETRKAHPSKYFLSYEQWVNTLHALIEKYNSTAQEGRILDGLSPDEAYAKFMNPNDPPAALPAELRCLLAHHRFPVTIGKEGIRFKKLGRIWHYLSEPLGKLRGQRLLAWWNPDAPELITVTTLNRKNPITAALVNDVPAKGGSALATELEKVASFMRFPKSRYIELKTQFEKRARPMIKDRDYAKAAELCAKIDGQQARARAELGAEQSRRRSVDRKASELQVPREILSGRPETNDYLEMMREAKREHGKEKDRA